MILSVIKLLFQENKSEQGLEFDLDAFKKLKTDAENSRTELLNEKANVVKRVEELKNNWNTEAGKEFFSKLDADWADCVDKYTKTMQAFIDVMDDLIETYEIVKDDAEALNLSTNYVWAGPKLHIYQCLY